MRNFALACLAAVIAALPSMALANDWPRLVRVTSRVIELPPATMSGWLADREVGGHELHAKALELALAGRARIIDTMVITTRSGLRTSVGSTRMAIHPSGNNSPINSTDLFNLPGMQRPFSTFTNFEIMVSGFVQKIEVIEDGEIELQIDHEMSSQSGSVVFQTYIDQWGDASVRLPLKDSKRIRTAVFLVPGRFSLLGVHTHLPTALPETPREWMVFVKAEVLIQQPIP